MMHILSRPQGLAERIAASSGWRRRANAVLLGLLATLALPPVHAIPLLLIAFPGLVWLIDGSRDEKAAFGAGWWFGFGHYSAGIYWIACALLIDPLRYGWMIPFAVLGLGAVLALFSGAASFAAHRLAPAGVPRVLALAISWTVFEWARSWVLTGFTWNLIGTVWLPVLPVAQFASLFGTYGLGALTVAVAALPAVLVRRRRAEILAVAGGFALLAVVAVWGGLRIPAGPSPLVPDVTLRLVQANIPQSDKWEPELRLPHLREHIRLSEEPAATKLSAIIWPETAAPVFLDQDPAARRLLSAAVPPGGLLITGAPRGTLPGVEPFQIWNSLQALNERGEVVASFDKYHLVPFGEYMPYKHILPLPKVTAGSTDFSAGPGPATIDLPGLPPAGPMICYEAIFPGEIVDRDHRPQWLLNVTNDGWFGLSAGPYQHFAAARLRAIEEGLPLARAANTGISAMIDPYGRVLGQLALGEGGVLDIGLPASLATPPLYARFGNGTVFLLLLLIGAAAAVWSRLFA